MKTTVVQNSKSQLDISSITKKSIEKEKQLTEGKGFNAFQQKRQDKADTVMMYISETINLGNTDEEKVAANTKIIESMFPMLDIDKTFSDNEATLHLVYENITNDPDLARSILIEKIKVLETNIDDLLKEHIEIAISDKPEDQLKESMVLEFYKLQKEEQLLSESTVDDLTEQGFESNEQLIKKSISQVKLSLFLENMNLTFKEDVTVSKLKEDVMTPLFELC